MPDHPATGYQLDDPRIGPLLDDVLAERKVVREWTRVRAQRVVQLNGGIMLLYALDLARLLPGSGEARVALYLLAVIVPVAAIGAFLVSRPVPRHPVRAAIGSVLLPVGGVWTVFGSMSWGLTWVLLYELFPEPIARLLTDIGAYRPQAGLIVMGIGIWGVFSGTWTRKQRPGVELYEASADEQLEDSDVD